MKKILVYGLGSVYGGIENVVISFINYVSNRSDLKFNILLNNKSGCQWINRISNRNVEYSIIRSWGSNPIAFEKDIVKLVKENEFDYIWMNVASLTTLTFINKLCKSVKTQLIIHAHGANLEYQNLFVGLISRLLHFCNRRRLKGKNIKFVACSKKAGIWMFGNSGFEIIYNGINVDNYHFDIDVRKRVRTALKVKDETLYLFVGRLAKVKNVSFLLDIFKHIVISEPNSKLLIAGDGPEREILENKVKDYNLIEKVSFLGFQREINSLFNASDVFVLPSLHEGFPLVVLEAQCSGIRTYVSDTIPEEVDVSDNVKRLSLSNSADDWAKNILSHSETSRMDNSSLIIEHKLDNKSMCASISALFV